MRSGRFGVPFGQGRRNVAATSTEAKRTVLVSLVLTGVLTALGSVIGGKAKPADIPPLRIYVGCAVAAIILTLLADPAPELAASFAVLIVFGAMFVQIGTVTKLAKLVGG